MNQKIEINLLRKAFWRVFSLTAFLLFVSQKIEQLRKKTLKGIEIANHAPVPLYWASEEKRAPVAGFTYQELYPAPFQQVYIPDWEPFNATFNQGNEGEEPESSEHFGPPPNWELINGRNEPISHHGIFGGGCLVGMN